MLSSIIKSQKHTSLISLYFCIKIDPQKMRTLFSEPLSAQLLLKVQSELLEGGTLSLCPSGSGELLLCIKSKSYALTHSGALMIKAFLQSSLHEQDDTDIAN